MKKESYFTKSRAHACAAKGLIRFLDDVINCLQIFHLVKDGIGLSCN